MALRSIVAVRPRGLRPRNAARYLGVSLTFLQGLPITPVRIRGTGPKGKAIVLYLLEELDGWLDQEAAHREPEIRTRAAPPQARRAG